MASWDSNKVKTQLRYTAQRLGQIQDKLESQGQITRRDIATLLQQGNLPLARAKAQKLVSQDIYGDLLQTLEMHVGVILEHFGELEKSEAPSPLVVEAASSIIFAAPQIDSRDLLVVRDILCGRLGPDFARSAAGNVDGYVSPRIAAALSAGPLQASKMDRFLLSIARAHNVKWIPDMGPEERVNAISEMLDPASIPEIDLKRLRELCAHGLPENPPWLRPRVWKLLLGTLPTQKAAWKQELSKQRENYYDLVRRLLEPFSGLPPPDTPLSTLDATLNDTSKELSRVPQTLFAKLEGELEGSDLCPLDSSAPEEIKITCAGALDDRLLLIRESERKESSLQPNPAPEVPLEGTPEIRLEQMEEGPSEGSDKLDALGIDLVQPPSTPLTPEISLSVPGSPTSTHTGATTTLLPSRPYNTWGAHQKHASALLRLLYIHSTLNPANRAPQIASLLVPVYAALVEEVEPEDLAHLEADAFWLFETIVGEFSELEEVEGGNVWMQKLGERVIWADADLAEILQAKGLEPSLPHYSYRWITTLLTHTLPLSAVLMVWDALLSRPGRERDSNPKLDYLIDVCTSMLLSARSSLYRLGKPQSKALSFWADADIATLELGERELEDAFSEGMTMLQNYPLRDVGGIENILQLAFDLYKRRQAVVQAPAQATMTVGGLGARLRNSMWGGWTPQATITETREEGHEETGTDEDDSDSEDDQPLQQQQQQLQQRAQQKHRPPPLTSNPARNALSLRLAQTVWKGITNQSAMETPPTPQTPAFSPSPSEADFSSKDSPSTTNGAPRGSVIWGYAEKFRDSDAAATLAKVSTNWRVKAMDAWSKRGSVAMPAIAPSSRLSPSWVPKHGGPSSASVDISPSQQLVEDPKRNSLPEFNRPPDPYSPPARPAFFAPVRDSWMPEARRDQVASPTGSDHSAHSAVSDSIGSVKRRQDSLSVTTNVPDRDQRTPSPNSAGSVRSGGPRPLLLNSTGSLFTHTRQPTLPASTTDKQFAETVRSKRPTSQRDSQSSLSSLSPSDRNTFRAPRNPSAGESRVVPLNRKTPSPMARGRRQESTSSAASEIPLPPLPQAFSRRFPTEESSSRRSSGEQSAKDIIAQAAPRETQRRDTLSSQAPGTPVEASNGKNGSVRVAGGESQRGSVVLSEFGEVEPANFSSSEKPAGKFQKRANTSLARLQIDESSDSSTAISRAPTRSARVVRSKRYPPRLAGASKDMSRGSLSAIERSSTLAAPEWAEEVEVTTPRATTFSNGASAPSSPRRRKVSNEGRDGRRKVSSEGRQPKHKRESAAVDGDDEGYDELLSAYESEDSAARL